MSGTEEEFNRREVAWRLFASEFRDADLSYAESDEERAPNYVVTPTGARVNRLFVVGVLTEVEYVSDDYLRARIVDPTGAFVVYAGQYQPEALTFLESAETPTFVAVTGKARTFQPEDSDVVYTSVRPEAISEVDADTRDNWVVTTAEQTIARLATMADALDLVERGDDLRAVLEARHVPSGLAAGVTLAIDHYGTTEHYLAAQRDLAFDAARVVAGEMDEVDQYAVDPDETGEAPVVLDLDDFTLATGDAQPVTTDADQGSTDGDAPTADEPVSATADATESASAAESEPDAAGDAAAATGASADPAEAVPTDAGESESTPPETAAGTDSAPPDPSATESAGESETEPAVESETESATDADAGSTPAREGENDADPADDQTDTDELYELSEEERREVEENYDVEFSTADEVEGEAGIEPEAPQPDQDEAAATSDDGAAAAESMAAADDAAGASDDADAADDGDADAAKAADETSSGEPPAETATENATGEDLEDAVVQTMQALGDGDAANRDDLVEAVMEAHDVDEGAVEDAIQDALMSGRCYESGENELTAI